MRYHANTNQLAFDSLLADAEEENGKRLFLKSVAHLPGTWDEAIPFYKTLLQSHHAAMLEADEDKVVRLRGEAHGLAIKLNGGTAFGICAGDGPGKRLELETTVDGEAPLWGQAAIFRLDHEGMAVRIEIDGLFGAGASYELWPGFKAQAVNRRKPFISESGFRSFRGCSSGLIPGITPQQYVSAMLAGYIDGELHGELVRVKPQRSTKTAA